MPGAKMKPFFTGGSGSGSGAGAGVGVCLPVYA